ncbi:MAG: EamA family transporter [Austwickia sp.]|nr:EamA family transporter [Actinomycetota bacterium]MCO5310688.1 EamA family transporter [Austwickia sp.]
MAAVSTSSTGLGTTTSGYPVALVLASILSVQFGGALAATLIPVIGVLGSVALRLGIGALVMLAVARPRIGGHTRADWLTAATFGIALAVMNSTFYGALGRLPIGVAVTIEFLGPLLLAAALSRHLLDGVAVLAAGVGVVLISQVASTARDQVDVIGIGLALLAGAAWAAYILLSARTGRAFGGTEGLAWAMVVAAALVVPAGLVVDGTALFAPDALIKGAGIAILSSVLPYSLELLALRRLDPRVFGILLSLEPAAAALAGLLILHQSLTAIQLAGMALVVCASAVVTMRSAAPVD